MTVVCPNFLFLPSKPPGTGMKTIHGDSRPIVLLAPVPVTGDRLPHMAVGKWLGCVTTGRPIVK